MFQKKTISVDDVQNITDYLSSAHELPVQRTTRVAGGSLQLEITERNSSGLYSQLCFSLPSSPLARIRFIESWVWC